MVWGRRRYRIEYTSLYSGKRIVRTFATREALEEFVKVARSLGWIAGP